MVFICGLIFLIIILMKVRKMIIEFILIILKLVIIVGIGIFLVYVGIKNVGFLKFLIDFGMYDVVGKGVVKGLVIIIVNFLVMLGLVLFDNLVILLFLIGLSIIIFFIVKGICGGIILLILIMIFLGILMGVVKLDVINWEVINFLVFFRDLK